MHPELLVKALAAIEPNTNLENFWKASGIGSASVAQSVLDFLTSNDIGTITKNTIEFSGSDRLHAALLALRMGCDIERVSGRLSWKDFEKLASEVLISCGYRTQTNLQMTKPRMEVDVIGVSSGFAIAVDCKHWKRSSPSSLAGFSKKQAARTARLLGLDKTICSAVPMIMTLHAEPVNFSNGVPVVPVHKFRSFVNDVKDFLPEIYVAYYDRTSIAK
jgi:hypothetical protein